MKLFHGTINILKEPTIGYSQYNSFKNWIKTLAEQRLDYGPGFYVTENEHQADLWAVNTYRDSGEVVEFIDNPIKLPRRIEFDLNTDNLKVLNLCKESPQVTLAFLLKNNFNYIGRYKDNTYHQEAEYLQRVALEYIKDYEEYFKDFFESDYIIGPRFDSKYNRVVTDFCFKNFLLDQFKELLQIGAMGPQVFLKTTRAIDNLQFIGYEEIEEERYYELIEEYDVSDIESERQYKSIVKESFDYANK